MTMFTGVATNFDGGRSKKTEEWTNRYHLSLKSMQGALSVLYDGLEADQDGINSNADREQGLLLKDEQTLSQAAEVFIQHCQNLVFMLSEAMNGTVRLPLGSVLSTISRCLRVAPADVKSVPSMSELVGILPKLHRMSLDLLLQLIVSCKTSLLPQSRVIIDLCVQSLTLAKQMDSTEKSKTRAYAYQALCLIVQVFGWGKYLARLSKTVIQELISDIKWQNFTRQVTTIPENESKQEAVTGNRKKGKKKKNKGESYGDLAKSSAVIGSSGMNDIIVDCESTIGALELSKMMLGRAEFLCAENLMRCILDTAQSLQRESPPPGSPYTKVHCRSKLYSTVFACSAVKLDPGCTRKDSITHFQMSNMALNLLSDGVHKECAYEVQSTCQECLNVLQMMSNLNRPIIRRIQPDDKNVTQDVTELERELVKVRDENENLQKKVLDLELESQAQAHQLSALKKEVATLKESKIMEISTCAEQKVYLTDPADDRLLESVGESLSDNEFDTEESDDEDKNENEEAGKIKKLKGAVKENERGIVSNASTAVIGSQDNHSQSTKRKSSAQTTSEAGGEMKRSRLDSSISRGKDMPSTSHSQAQDEKESNSDDSVQAMISDFIDADPDLL